MTGARATAWLIFAGMTVGVAPARAAPAIADVQAMLAAGGAQVTRHDRAAGDPYLDVIADRLAWRLYFVDCGTRQPPACRAMSLRIGFAHATDRRLENLNRWNQTHLFARAFLDGDGTPTLALDVPLDGTDHPAIAAYLQRWQTDTMRFRDFVERKPEP